MSTRIVLIHALTMSMAPAAHAVRAGVACPVLTSPDAAVARLKLLLG